MKKIAEIKKIIKNECANLGYTGTWFYDIHLLGVEKFAKELLNKFPEANREIVMLGVWLHDLQRVRGKKGDHAKIGAEESEKVMRQFQYSEKIIKRVGKIILSHSCDTKLKPKSLDGKILASADAMSHYINDFYLVIATTGERNLIDYKKWALKKLNKDYNKKIFFDFAKKKIKARHNVLWKLFTMK